MIFNVVEQSVLKAFKKLFIKQNKLKIRLIFHLTVNIRPQNLKVNKLSCELQLSSNSGSTSAVSGVKLAVDEIIRGRRKGARLMVVLISDGNSQDPW